MKKSHVCLRGGDSDSMIKANIRITIKQNFLDYMKEIRSSTKQGNSKESHCLVERK